MFVWLVKLSVSSLWGALSPDQAFSVCHILPVLLLWRVALSMSAAVLCGITAPDCVGAPKAVVRYQGTGQGP